MTEGLTMRTRMNLVSCFFIAMATGACGDDAGDVDADGQLQEAVGSAVEIRLRKIQALQLNEGGDEIYLTATSTASSSTNIIRPAGDPDYWRFDNPGTVHTMNQHVGTAVPGAILTIRLWEQDNASLGNPHDLLGFV